MLFSFNLMYSMSKYDQEWHNLGESTAYLPSLTLNKMMEKMVTFALLNAYILNCFTNNNVIEIIQ